MNFLLPSYFSNACLNSCKLHCNNSATFLAVISNILHLQSDFSTIKYFDSLLNNLSSSCLLLKKTMIFNLYIKLEYKKINTLHLICVIGI